MSSFDLVVKAWTPIGSKGFQYYWDPDWVEPLTGCKEVHYMNPDAGYSVQRTVNPDQAASLAFLEWFIPNSYVAIERGWLRNRYGEGY